MDLVCADVDVCNANGVSKLTEEEISREMLDAFFLR